MTGYRAQLRKSKADLKVFKPTEYKVVQVTIDTLRYELLKIEEFVNAKSQIAGNIGLFVSGMAGIATTKPTELWFVFWAGITFISITLLALSVVKTYSLRNHTSEALISRLFSEQTELDDQAKSSDEQAKDSNPGQ